MEVEHDLVEAYFESNGFLVRQAGRPESLSTRKKLESLLTLAIFNPAVGQNATDLGFRLYTSDLKKIRSGLVSLLGWGNSGFTNGMLNNDSLLIKYFKKELKDNRLDSNFSPGPELAESGMGSFMRLLIVPALPRNETKITEVFTILQKNKVDGVLTTRSILENLLRQSDPGHFNPGKPFSQILNLLKAYELAKEPQLEMF
ncbi:hypothetical protein N9N41_01380 [Opitutales bacterium]|nr:hypothetical protein [Opitutales bacterium]